MAITNKIENFRMQVNEAFVNKAEALRPRLLEKEVTPRRLVKILPQGEDYRAEYAAPAEALGTMPLGRGGRVCLDFGDHQVGYVSFRLTATGSPPDAPAWVRLKFGEIPYEIAADSSAYHGSIAKGWIQEEFLHVDSFPAVISLPRRYAFRYMELYVMDTSPKYRLLLEDVRCVSVSSADPAAVTPLPTTDPALLRMDKVSLKTMQDCMQLVFEDGPKRDRRLWIGDLRLQALTNYVSFRNNDLVKRCLYLFAGLTQNEGRVGACLFLEPKLQVDDTSLFDYSLFFVSCLHDYYEATHDTSTLQELFPTADRQIELSLQELDDSYVVKDKNTWWCFLDWAEGLNKQAGAQAILIYALKQARLMAKWLGDERKAAAYADWIERTTQGALGKLWDEGKGFFLSGSEGQISWASQVWFVLAGVFPRERNAALLKHLIEENPPLSMVTPYMYHHFIEALFQSGLPDLAKKYLQGYWGRMLEDGADTFYELYDPENKAASPYGDRLANSFCHAWSGTPAYFIRKYMQ